MNIGQLAAKAGVATSAIRYYEAEGLLEPPARQSGWRRYDTRAYDRLLVIQAARELGFGIAEIRTLLNPQRKGAKPAARWRAFAKKKLAEVDATLQRAATMKRLIEAGLHCDCGEIGTCICSKGESCYPQQVIVKVSEVR
jgi:DNA-binding transcriptional MerR regulator